MGRSQAIGDYLQTIADDLGGDPRARVVKREHCPSRSGHHHTCDEGGRSAARPKKPRRLVLVAGTVPWHEHDAEIDVVAPDLTLHDLHARHHARPRGHIAEDLLDLAGRDAELRWQLAAKVVLVITSLPGRAILVVILACRVRQHTPTQDESRDGVRLSGRLLGDSQGVIHLNGGGPRCEVVKGDMGNAACRQRQAGMHTFGAPRGAIQPRRIALLILKHHVEVDGTAGEHIELEREMLPSASAWHGNSQPR
mmetsp:Transcript_16264/g.32713  ORF Transcript_16264/g.32713 Transcript_16264/m.32713 type:complete len:252 (-) Transcript_16264:75-830(-)